MSAHQHHRVTHHHLLGMFACAALGAILFVVIAFAVGWMKIPQGVSTEALPIEAGPQYPLP